eukprot:gene28170-31270_t
MVSGSKSSISRAAKAKEATASRVFAGALSTGLWMMFSSSIIILNRNLYKMGFPYPFFVTAWGMVFSALGALVLVGAGMMPLRRPPSMKFCIYNLLPIIFSSAASLFFGNVAYLYLSVTFIQILKSFTPALTLLLCVFFGLEKFKWPILLSISLISLGTAGAVMIESGTPGFSALGVAAFMASSLTEAWRVVGTEVLLGKRYNTAEALVYVGGPTAVLLFTGSALWEGQGLADGGLALALSNPTPFIAAFVMSFLVNLSCFFAIQTTSSLTFKVAGCVKNLAVVWYGVAAHGEIVTFMQMMGYMVSVVGFAMYSKIKLLSKPVPKSSQKTKVKAS